MGLKFPINAKTFIKQTKSVYVEFINLFIT